MVGGWARDKEMRGLQLRAQYMALAAEGPNPVIVVTTFSCPTRSSLCWVRWMHTRIGRDVLRSTDGLLGVSIITKWRRRVAINVSLWRSPGDIYSMGESKSHVAAAHMLARLKVATSCGIFDYRGEWKEVLIGTVGPKSNPLLLLTNEEPE